MKPFTVLLVYPDFLSENYGKETYLAHVDASDPEDAIHRAQLQACAANAVPDDPDYYIEPDSFYVTAIFNGHLQDLKT